MALQAMMTHLYSSVIRGHHVYKDTWMPYIEEKLMLDCEDTNQFNRCAVAVMKNREIMGHMPRTITKLSWFFLKKRDTIEERERKDSNWRYLVIIFILDHKERSNNWRNYSVKWRTKLNNYH